MAELLAIEGLAERTSEDFRRELVAVGARLGLNPSYLAAVMCFETAKTFDPAIRNPYSSATGLIQFMEATARRLGTTTAELAAMSAVEQLRYVEDYYRPMASRVRTRSDYYLAVFAPAGLGQPEAFPLYSAPSAAYEANRALDHDGDGVIRNAEAAAGVLSIIARAEKLPPIVVADGPSISEASSSGLAGGLVLGALAWLAVRLARRG